MTIEVQPGYVTVVERFGKFSRLLKPGKHNLIPGIEKAGATFQVGTRTLSDTVDTNDNHAINTVDGIKIGYRYEVFLDIRNPEKFYKTDFMYPNCTGLKADAEWMIEDKMSNFRYADVIETFNRESDGDWLSLNDDELRYVQKAADKADIKIISIKFSLFFGKDFDYWKSFCRYANESSQFVSCFGKMANQFDSGNTIELPGKDGRYAIRLLREKAKGIVSVMVKVRSGDTNYHVLTQRHNFIENKLRWNLDWVANDGEFAYAKAIIQAPEIGDLENDGWKRQFELMITLATGIKKIFSEILDEYGTPDVINVGNAKVEVMACVCSNCGGAIDTGTRICPFCGANQMIVTK